MLIDGNSVEYTNPEQFLELLAQHKYFNDFPYCYRNDDFRAYVPDVEEVRQFIFINDVSSFMQKMNGLMERLHSNEDRYTRQQVVINLYNVLRASRVVRPNFPTHEYLQALREFAIHDMKDYDVRDKDSRALNVEQGSAGFSAEAPIGTNNIRDCFALILRDPVTHKTCVVHISKVTDIKSISAIFSRMPAHRLEARIIGIDPHHPEARPKLIELIALARNRDINWLSADILHADQTKAFVVHPFDGSLKAVSPAINGPNEVLYLGRTTSNTVLPLQIAFDLTVSDSHAAILLDRNSVNTIQNWQVAGGTKNITAFILDGLYEKNKLRKERQPSMVGISLKLYEAYQAGHSKIIDAVNAKIREIGVSGGGLKGTDARTALEGAENLPLHIGVGADEANQPLFQFIETELFRPKQRGKKIEYELNSKGLRDFNFSSQPYSIVERNARGFQSIARSAESETQQRK